MTSNVSCGAAYTSRNGSGNYGCWGCRSTPCLQLFHYIGI